MCTYTVHILCHTDTCTHQDTDQTSILQTHRLLGYVYKFKASVLTCTLAAHLQQNRRPGKLSLALATLVGSLLLIAIMGCNYCNHMNTDRCNDPWRSLRPETDQYLVVPNCKETKVTYKGRSSWSVTVTTRC